MAAWNPRRVLDLLAGSGAPIVENMNSPTIRVNPDRANARNAFEEGRDLVSRHRSSLRIHGENRECAPSIGMKHQHVFFPLSDKGVRSRYAWRSHW